MWILNSKPREQGSEKYKVLLKTKPWLQECPLLPQIAVILLFLRAALNHSSAFKGPSSSCSNYRTNSIVLCLLSVQHDNTVFLHHQASWHPFPTVSVLAMSVQIWTLPAHPYRTAPEMCKTGNRVYILCCVILGRSEYTGKYLFPYVWRVPEKATPIYMPLWLWDYLGLRVIGTQEAREKHSPASALL